MTWRSASPPVRSRLLGEDGVATLDEICLTLEFTTGRWRFKTAVALRSYPLDAITDLVYDPPGAGRNGSISVAVAPGRDPLREFRAGRGASARTDPDCLVVTADQAAAAEHFVARARAAVAQAAASDTLVATGRLPIEVTGADGTVRFDGRSLLLTFDGRGADRSKRDLGTRLLPVTAIHGVEVRRGDDHGWIRFVPAVGPPEPRLPPALDPDTLCLNPDSSRRHLVLAAAVTRAVPRRRPALDLPPARRLTSAVPRQRPPNGTDHRTRVAENRSPRTVPGERAVPPSGAEPAATAGGAASPTVPGERVPPPGGAGPAVSAGRSPRTEPGAGAWPALPGGAASPTEPGERVLPLGGAGPAATAGRAASPTEPGTGPPPPGGPVSGAGALPVGAGARERPSGGDGLRSLLEPVPADRLGREAALVRAAGLAPYRLPSAGEQVAVVGESHHQPALRAVAGGRAVLPSVVHAAIGAIAVLVPEPGNRYHTKAVRVDLLDSAGGTRTAGYLPPYLATACHDDLAGIRPGFGYCPARIFGGGQGRSYGVHLRLSAQAILPFRNPYPDGLLLYAERRVTLAEGSAHSPVLSRFAPGPRQPRVWVMAELSPATVTSGAYEGEPTIAVSLGGHRVGQASRGQARHCEHLVRSIRAAGERVLCEGYVHPEPDGRCRVELFLPRG